MKKHISLTQAYIIAFLLLGMWAFFAYLTMHSQIQAQDKYAQLINVSGKQRMLSQRTALLANHYLYSQDPAYLDELKDNLRLMKEDHDFLVGHIPSRTIHDIYFRPPYRLEEKTRAYFDLLDQFVGRTGRFTSTQIYVKTSQLLPVLDHAVNIYEQESSQKTAWLMRLEGYILAGSLLTLLLEALLIIRPALRRANWNNRKLAEMAARQTEKLTIYEQIFANSNDGIMITDKDNRILDSNPSFTRITGYRADEVKYKKPDILKSSHQEDSFYRNFWNELDHQGKWTGEFINRKKDGSIYYQRTYAFLLRDDDRQIKYHVAIMSDISEMKEDKNRLENLALYDMLTHLPNRALFHSQVHKAIERSRRYQHKLAVILIDLDNFKSINDTLTHRVGDQVLQNVGEILDSCTRNLDTVARLGGDEFVMLIEEIEDENHLLPILEKIQMRLAEPMQVDSYQLPVTCSMGVAIFPDDADTYETLVQYADTAMYHAKKSGKNRFSFFTGQLNDAVQQRLLIEHELAAAMANQEFFLKFQPIFALEGQTVAGYEVLLNWQNKTLGRVPPETFLPVAESLGQIRAIDNWVLEQVRGLLEGGCFGQGCLAVNISAKRFGQKDFVDDVRAIFTDSSVAKRITLELTEAALVDDIDSARGTLDRLAAAGFSISLDDFGTGYSSLSELNHLPIHSLKIDKSFVMAMESSGRERMIIDSIIAMAQKMDLKVIAEGIETPQQLDYLRASGYCQYGQGYYFSEPLDRDAAEALWRKDGKGMCTTVSS